LYIVELEKWQEQDSLRSEALAILKAPATRALYASSFRMSTLMLAGAVLTIVAKFLAH
jgi:hypothetical protein